MEDIDGGLHPAVDGQSLDEDDEDEVSIDCQPTSGSPFAVSVMVSVY